MKRSDHKRYFPSRFYLDIIYKANKSDTSNLVEALKRLWLNNNSSICDRFTLLKLYTIC